jgi:methionyl-tRNA formyltransferase
VLSIVFMGTPDFAVPTLEAILGAGHRVVAVYTRPPRPAGRGMAERPSPVHQRAIAAGIEVRTPRSLRAAAEQADFAALRSDVAVVVAYGLILPKAILDAPRHGCLNLHASRLPRWRGAAPIQRAIMAGDRETAASVMVMEEGLDSGPVARAETVAIGSDTTAGELHDALMAVGARLMVAALADLEAGGLAAAPQPDAGVTYAAKIDKAEARIDFAAPAAAVHDRIRGLSPHPGAWIEAGPARERIKVLRSALVPSAPAAAPGTVLDDRLTIACGAGAVRLLELQRAGKRAMAADELLRGFAIPPGVRL